MTDLGGAIADAVATARARGESLYVHGGDSKRHLVGREAHGTPLDVSRHRGIVDYHPTELVLTARAGTRLSEIQDTLAEHRQYMSFEPPRFGERATLGGTLACNLSGPARPWCGSIRDMVLGVTLVNGRGEQLNFGGTVMKNVAGYDVSRLQAGALGTLGVITEISLKVLPRPEDSLTLAYTVSAADALEIMNRRAAEPRPLTGAFWADGRLYLRLAGPTRAVQHAARDWGGERLPGDNPLWQQLRDMQLPFFTEAGELWRLSVRSTAPVDTPPGSTLIDWGGALRWVRGEADFPSLQSSASAAGGHAALFRGGDRLGEVRQQPEPVERRLLLRLKQAFDPDRVLNPGRLHSWL